MQLPDGIWRMWYKDERKTPTLSYADSPDLFKWEPKGNAVTNFSGEGPKVFHWNDSYWLVADCWNNGMRVWRSDDCLNWKLQDQALLGSHGDVVVSGNRAWWFYFGGPKPFGATDRDESPASTNAAPAPRRNRGRVTAINVVELTVKDGKLIPGDPTRPTYVDLKSVREEER